MQKETKPFEKFRVASTEKRQEAKGIYKYVMKPNVGLFIATSQLVSSLLLRRSQSSVNRLYHKRKAPQEFQNVQN